MRNIILLTAILLFSAGAYSIETDTAKEIAMKGKSGFAAPNTVKVEISSGTLTTMFIQDMKDVVITVRKKTGEMVYCQSLRVEEFDRIPILLRNYEQGDYSIEISSSEGTLQGDFKLTH